MGDDEKAVFSGSAEDWLNNAQLMHYMASRGFGDKWRIYARGYRDAADLLVQGVIERRGHPDFLVYPILFLYRQYLEITIKGHLRQAMSLLGIEPPKRPGTSKRHLAGQGHNLLALWEYLLNLLPEVDPGFRLYDWSAANRVITAFHEVDEKGDAARFPELFTGDPSLTKIQEVNLRSLKEEIDRAWECALVVIEGGMDYNEHLKQEADSYLPWDY